MIRSFHVGVAAMAFVIGLAEGPIEAMPGMAQASRQVDCADWRDCRQLALAAAAGGEFETFHNLAWRAVQKGPPKDPSLMYLLARAQALSGRAHDALVMLERLAEMGVATDAVTNEDFTQTRQLAGWPEVEARILATTGRGTSPLTSEPAGKPRPAPAATPQPVAPATPPPVAPAIPPGPVSTAATAAAGFHFSTRQFMVSGVAYDAVSRRFVVGDRLGRKLFVVDERSHATTDLVGAASAGFFDIAALAIDEKRGDLWVASTGSSGEGTLHKLQLVSGRPLRSFRVPSDREPVKLVDLAIAPSGTVVVLDAMTPQLFVLPAGGTALESVMRLDVQNPTGVAAGREEGTVFVSHQDGVSRIDLRSHSATLLAVPKGASLRGLGRIRRHGNGLIAVQVDDDGARRVLRLEMNESEITRAVPLAVSIAPAEQTFAMTIAGNDLVYLIADPAAAGRSSSADTIHRQFVVYRVPLR
jgi:hypothetical protein